jgi:hypothetical protein
VMSFIRRTKETMGEVMSPTYGELWSGCCMISLIL